MSRMTARLYDALYDALDDRAADVAETAAHFRERGKAVPAWVAEVAPRLDRALDYLGRREVRESRPRLYDAGNGRLVTIPE